MDHDCAWLYTGKYKRLLGCEHRQYVVQLRDIWGRTVRNQFHCVSFLANSKYTSLCLQEMMLYWQWKCCTLALNFEAVYFTKMLVPLVCSYKSTQLCDPEGHHWHLHCHQNLMLHILSSHYFVGSAVEFTF